MSDHIGSVDTAIPWDLVFLESNLGMAIGDMDGCFRHVNEAFAEMCGYSVDELVGRPGTMVLVPEEISRLRNQQEKVHRDGRTTFETRCRRKDGTEFPVRIEASVISTGGVPRGRLLMAVDISRDVATRRALETSEAKYRTLFEQDPSAILMVDWEDLRILDANPAAQQMYGYSRDEITKLLASDLSWEPEKTKTAISQLEEGRTAHVPVRIHRRKDGTRFTVELTGTDFQLDGRRTNCTMVRDIDQQLARQEELRQSREQLQRLSRHLQRSREDERARVAREIHDDLAQTLTAVSLGIQERLSGLAGGPAEDPHDGELLDLVNSAITSVRRISARLRPGVLDHLGLAPALEWLCEDVLKWSQMKVVVSSPFPEIALSRHRSTAVYRICQEALINAARHAEAASVSVRLEVEGDLVTLTVSDDGVGISNAALESVDSVGLVGLYEMAAAFDGALRIERNPERGTRVTLTMPCKSEVREP